ncbi:hypothetical protein RM704_23150 [Streptomyces sp. DSM 3412]|uniref:Uncharacterized protein n=1 Tax=Streptomyces gottesmaniae TaxID=3075518 RepID=A0ABU2Z1Z1_9ACTN|nr:hypothetical protein [Streptomyces sp. DSM 3412]MDT0570330.1 hypothetical protein [Streptomyces sp. DSM 3412]
MMRRAEVRDDIAIDCLGRAVPAFMSDVLPEWDPDKGRSLDGFFLHLALCHFRDAYRRWATGHRRRLGAVLGPDKIWIQGRKHDMVYDEVWELVPAPALGLEEQTVLRETLSVILAETSARRLRGDAHHRGHPGGDRTAARDHPQVGRAAPEPGPATRPQARGGRAHRGPLGQLGGDPVNGPLDLRVLVLLLAGAVVGYIAYAHPAVGVALLVAVAVVTLLYLLMGPNHGLRAGFTGRGWPASTRLTQAIHVGELMR